MRHERDRSQDLFHIHLRMSEAINREVLAIVGEDGMREFVLSYSGDSAEAEALLALGARYEAGRAERQEVVDACVAVIEDWKRAARQHVAQRERHTPPRAARR